MIEFFVETKPQPQGSSRAFIIGGKARITSANKNLKPYREVVTEAAKLAVMSECGITSWGIRRIAFVAHEPVKITLVFTHLRPPSAPRVRTQMVVKPDLDKLVRATCDALTGCVWHDDAQVVHIDARKVYGERQGVLVKVEAAQVSRTEVRE